MIEDFYNFANQAMDQRMVHSHFTYTYYINFERESFIYYESNCPFTECGVLVD